MFARACLRDGITSVFIPAGKPWRTGVIEHFNDTFDKRVLRSKRLVDRPALAGRAPYFEHFHNANHRYAATRGRAPDESEPEIQPGKPRALADLPEGWPGQARVELVRFIRPYRKLRLMYRPSSMPKAAVCEYVTAVLDLAIPVNEGNLPVHRDGDLLATTRVKLGGRD